MTGKLLRPFLTPGPSPDRRVADSGRLRFLGTAGFEIEASDGKILILDPYLTRPGLLRSAFGRLTPDLDLLADEIPRADAVLCGHSHHDHALDAPDLCKLTGAVLVGSRSTRNLGLAAGLDRERIVLIEDSRSAAGGVPPEAVGSFDIGASTVSALASRHGKAIFGRIPLPGQIDAPPEWPPRMWDMRHGAVYTWHIDVGDATLLHVDSADYIDETLRDIEVDVLLLCAIGRKYRDNYTAGIIEAVRPKVVVPCHWDDFSIPWGAPARQLPGCDVEGFCEEIAAAGVDPILLGLGERWDWSVAGIG